MKRTSLIGLSICLFFFAVCIYSYLDMQNAVTRLRIEVPKLAKELRSIEEENVRMRFAAESFENPQHLMMLARDKAFAKLKFPLAKEVVALKQGSEWADPFEQKLDLLTSRSRIALASRQP